MQILNNHSYFLWSSYEFIPAKLRLYLDPVLGNVPCRQTAHLKNKRNLINKIRLITRKLFYSLLFFQVPLKIRIFCLCLSNIIISTQPHCDHFTQFNFILFKVNYPYFFEVFPGRSSKLVVHLAADRMSVPPRHQDAVVVTL